MDFIKDCGLMVEPQEGMTIDELLDVASFAEKKGFGYFFRSDHLLPTSRKKGLDSPECWVTLGAIAARTRRIRFGPMVSPVGFRNPSLLARMAQTVDAMSRGRLCLGVGAGWYEDEYKAHGIEFPDLETRKRQFTEALEIIRPLTQVGRVDFRGGSSRPISAASRSSGTGFTSSSEVGRAPSSDRRPTSATSGTSSGRSPRGSRASRAPSTVAAGA